MPQIGLTAANKTLICSYKYLAANRCHVKEIEKKNKNKKMEATMNHASKYSKLLNDKRIPYMRNGLNLNQIQE